VEAFANELPLHVLEDVDQSQVRVRLDDYECGEERVEQYVGDVLGMLEWGEGREMG
jgi:hypothetical protein